MFVWRRTTRLGKQHWTREIAQAPPTVSYEAVMNNDIAVLEWLENVVRFSISTVAMRKKPLLSEFS